MIKDIMIMIVCMFLVSNFAEARGKGRYHADLLYVGVSHMMAKSPSCSTNPKLPCLSFESAIEYTSIIMVTWPEVLAKSTFANDFTKIANQSDAICIGVKSNWFRYRECWMRQMKPRFIDLFDQEAKRIK